MSPIIGKVAGSANVLEVSPARDVGTVLLRVLAQTPTDGSAQAAFPLQASRPMSRLRRGAQAASMPFRANSRTDSIRDSTQSVS